MKSLLLTLFTSGVIFATVDGTVTNQTTGRPQAGATVTLVKLGSGMETVGSAKSDAQGKFSIAADLAVATPYLVQTLYSGVSYNKAISPGSPSTGLSVDVFEASAKGTDAKVDQHMVLFEPSGTELTINETVIYKNGGKTTFDDPANGTFRFYLPPETNGKVAVEVSGPQGMPISRPAIKTKDANVYTIKYPVKPGETRFNLAYTMPSPSPGSFDFKVMHPDGLVRLVAPKGVILKSAQLKDLGPEPRTQATIYQLLGTDVKFDFTGTGSLRAAAEGAAPSEDTGPPIEDLKPRIYSRLYPLLGMAAVILLLGIVLLYRSEPGVKNRA